MIRHPVKPLLSAVAVTAFAFVPLTAANQPPASYDSFATVQFDAVTGQITNLQEQYLFFPPGDYHLDNPVLIDREDSLYLHGGDRWQTRLYPRNPSQPLFLVNKADCVNVTGLSFHRDDDMPTVLNSSVIRFKNKAPIEFEFMECRVTDMTIQITGPGSFRLQGADLQALSRVSSPLMVSHPLADVVVVAGNIGCRNPLDPGIPEYYHTWVQYGRLQMFTVNVQNAKSLADFRIDRASSIGPHIFANVRSEGTKCRTNGLPPSGLLYVPPSSEDVDVLLLNNSGSWFQATPAAPCATGTRFVDYNAAGTLWLIHNNGPAGCDHLVTGFAPGAEIIAVGNRIRNDIDPLPVFGATLTVAGTVFSSPQGPSGQFLDPDDSLDDPSLPAVPTVSIPPALTRPVVNSPLPGMVDVGSFQELCPTDTCALRAAFVTAQLSTGMVFIPAGDYHIEEPLYWQHSDSPFSFNLVGGWIAGPGADQTRIVSNPGAAVFLSEGIGHATIQGITFEQLPDPTVPEPVESCVRLENNTSVGFATKQVMFHDCRFVGGRHGVAFGMETPTNAEACMMVHCSFEEAKYGMGIGSFNALSHLVYHGSFIDNEITVGHDPQASQRGGTWSGYFVDVTGTTEKEFELLTAAAGVYFHHQWNSATEVLFDQGATGASFFPAFNQCELSTPLSTTPIDWGAGGGLLFLDSTLYGDEVYFWNALSAKFGVRIRGSIDGEFAASNFPDSIQRTYEWD